MMKAIRLLTDSIPLRWKYPGVLCALLFLTVVSCDLLFFPPSGEPRSGPKLRTTPQGVIDQLMRAYTEKRIDLFEDLLARNSSFRFYVSPSFAVEYSTRSNVTYEPEILQYHFVDGLNYYYWGHAEEVARHRNLFAHADRIEFPEPIIYDNLVYTVTSEHDTTNVEVLVTTGELRVHLPDQRIFSIDIERQVFFLERDDDDLWVIRDWFDLDLTPN